MTELNENLDLALKYINIALSLINKNENGIANIIDTKAEVLWKLGEIGQAVKIIEEALIIDPENDYYQSQKEKFLDSYKN